jgi:glutamine synthetase
MKVFLEYIWLVGNQLQELRSETKIDGCGYFEDRRPASNCDPYMVAYTMLSTVYNTVSINV